MSMYKAIFQQEVSKSEFYSFWSSLLDEDSKENVYKKLIKNKSFNKEDLMELFIWKNGIDFTKHQKKMISFNRIISKIKLINQLKVNFNQQEFNYEFKEIGFIWKIFLLHLINPYEYPIFDQHVYRAANYLTKGDPLLELTSINVQKREDYYYKDYIPFFKLELKEVVLSQSIDKALWTFGKFLKGYPKLVCVSQTSL